MNVLDINRNQCYLKRDIDEAILHSIESISHPDIKLQEPDYIAALTTIFLEDFYNILKRTFPGYGFSLSGVFCHQKPIVDTGSEKEPEKELENKPKKKPELGDILFVYADKDKNGEVKFNSLLFQAKVNKSTDFYLEIGKNDKHQLELYKKWPKFKYRKAGELNGVERDIFPKSIHDGAQYLIINKRPLKCKSDLRCGCCCGIMPVSMYCAVPDDILYFNECLSSELINMLKFKSGRTFDASPEETKDDWSKMIWDLLTILKNSRSKRKNIDLDPFYRLKEYHCYTHFSTGYPNDKTLLDDLVTEDISNESADDDCGVSVILIESQPMEQNNG